MPTSKKLILGLLVCFTGLEQEGGGVGFDDGGQGVTCNSRLSEISGTSK